MKKMPPQRKQREKESKDAATAATSSINGNATINHNNNVTTQANNNLANGAVVVNGTAIDSAAAATAASVAASANTAAATATATGATVNGVNGAATMASTAAEQLKLNGHQQEQELFLQAFEKPTQIYRFLRNRHGTSPIFLQRTLSYMKERMSRNHKKRSTFKIDNMLETLTQKSQTLTNNFFNIIYNGLFEKDLSTEHTWHQGDVVTVEATLYKITKSKRKDSTSDFKEVLSYSSSVIYNPHENLDQLTAISIPSEAIEFLGDQHTIYKLLFRIKVAPPANENAGGENNETPTKRPKILTKLYGCELIVYEKTIGCIPEGDYEAALQELNSSSIKSFSPKKRSWEILPDNYIPITMNFDVFAQNPTLKFRLTWSPSDIPKEFPSKDLDKYGNFVESLTNGDATPENGEPEINHNNNCIQGTVTRAAVVSTTKANAQNVSSKKPIVKTEKIQIVYNFLYSNNTRQQTEYTQEVICPWCGLDCMRLYSLLKHLKLCHARFNFTYQPAPGNGARIDVTINDSYDASYAGSPYDLAGPSGCSFARTCGPVRRTSVTNLLVCRPRRQKTCLDEFLVLDEDDLSNQRPYITGHNRLYHHTETCLPVHPKELDIDSEGESDPLWLRQKTIQMIDEFTDVNEGEKELMKLWNLHVMKNGYVGDCQLPLACEMFLDANGHEIIRKNIYRNFILHMCSLFDYGLVSPESLYKTVQKLQGILSKYNEGQEMMSGQREKQLKYWQDIGIHKQDEQKLKSPQKLAPALAASNANTQNKSMDMALGNNKKSAMQPPSKRSGTALKRSSLNSNGGINSSAVNGDKATGNGKSVAKKSASQDDDVIAAPSVKDKHNSLKRLSNGEKKLDGKAGGGGTRGDADNRSQTGKRRLSNKDAPQPQQPASKRHRNDSSSTTNNNAVNQNSIASNSNSTSTTTTRSSLNSKQSQQDTNGTTTTIQSKRLASRRQSIAEINSNSNSKTSSSTTSASSSSTQDNKSNGKTTSHALRTRLSVPLNNKSDKR